MSGEQNKLGGLRLWVGRATFWFVAVLALSLVYLDWRGGWGWRSSLVLFFPSQCWLGPLVVLAPAALLARRQRLCWLLLGAVILVFFFYMRFHCAFGRSNAPANFTLASNNIDQRDLTALWRFTKGCDPDVLAFQQTGRWYQAIRQRFSDRYVASVGEFTLVSRYPILSAEPVAGMTRRQESLAVRYELLRDGHPLVVYNIHMPTPRFFFRALRDDVLQREEYLPEKIGPGESSQAYAMYWLRRIELTRILTDALRREQKPFVLAGDFNMPDHGLLYREFNSRYTDVFARTGWGYGLTFPGNSTTFVSLYRPWLRIDYQFAGAGFVPLSCEVEPWTPAKHLALVGRYRVSNY